MEKQMPSIKVKPEVRELLELVRKKVIAQTGGDIHTITDTVKYVFESFLDNTESAPDGHWADV